MTHRIVISLIQLLRDAANQTAVDFQGLRILNPQMDTVYDDFVLFPDNDPEAMKQIEIALAVFKNRLSIYIRSMEWSPEEVCYEIDINKQNTDCNQIRLFLQEYLKACVLSWWYASRNAEFMARYATSATSSLDMLANVIGSTVGVRRVRWF